MEKIDKRVGGIDVLRGLCIVAVVLHHMNLRIHFHESALGAFIGPAADKVLFWSGYYGVRVFFVISGFLIAGWSLKRWGELRRIDLRQFYVMRFARIAPCLLGLLALLVLLDRLGVPRFTINTQRGSLGRALFAALTFHINWLEARTGYGYVPAAWDVLWSLSVEEAFYLFFPLLCAVVRKQALLIALLCAFVLLGPFARVVLTHNEIWADYGYLSCMDGIALGCLAAMFARRVKIGARLSALLYSGIALSSCVVIFRGTVDRLGLYKTGLDVAILQLGAALMVIALQQRFESSPALAPRSQPSFVRRAGAVPAAVLRWFGRNSYEVYLTHMLLVWPAVGLFQYSHQRIDAAPVWFLAATVGAGLLGYAISRFYSEPLNQILRSKLSRTASRAVTLQTVPQEP